MQNMNQIITAHQRAITVNHGYIGGEFEMPSGLAIVTIADMSLNGVMIVLGVNREMKTIGAITDASQLWGAMPGTFGRINVYFQGEKLMIQNNTGTPRTLNIVVMKPTV